MASGKDPVTHRRARDDSPAQGGGVEAPSRILHLVSSPHNGGASTAPRRACAHPIADVLIDLIDYPAVFREILRWKENHERHYCCFTNPYSVATALRDPEMLEALNSAALNLPDGVGTLLAADVLGFRHRGRVTGPSTMLEIIREGVRFGLRHYFFGGAEGVAERLAASLGKRFPGVIIAGTQCPPFRSLTEQENETCIEAINRASPDVVWVGLGTMKQEKWMYRNHRRIQACAMLGVGAAFDFHSGSIAWAPSWIRRFGLEWAYRLWQEPRRLWRRNLDSFAFLVQVLRQALVDTGPKEVQADSILPLGTPDPERREQPSRDDVRKAA